MTGEVEVSSRERPENASGKRGAAGGIDGNSASASFVTGEIQPPQQHGHLRQKDIRHSHHICLAERIQRWNPMRLGRLLFQAAPPM
jgi:hypothetical protein